MVAAGKGLAIGRVAGGVLLVLQEQPGGAVASGERREQQRQAEESALAHMAWAGHICLPRALGCMAAFGGGSPTG